MSDASTSSNRFIEKLRSFGELGTPAEVALAAATSRYRSIRARQDLIREGAREPHPDELRLSDALNVKRGNPMIKNPAMLALLAGFDGTYLDRRLRTAA